MEQSSLGHASEALITQSVGAAKFQELVALTKQWSGDEEAFARSTSDWTRFRARAEAALRARLIDPDSAKIEWPYGFLYGTWKPPFSKRIEGYWTCGLINARNRMGAYTRIIRYSPSKECFDCPRIARASASFSPNR